MKKVFLLFCTLTVILFADDINPDKERIGLIADKPKFFFEKSIQFRPIGDTKAPIWPCLGLELYVPREKTEWGLGGTIGLSLVLTRPGSKSAVYGVFSARAYGNYNINNKYSVDLGYESTKKMAGDDNSQGSAPYVAIKYKTEKMRKYFININSDGDISLGYKLLK